MKRTDSPVPPLEELLSGAGQCRQGPEAAAMHATDEDNLRDLLSELEESRREVEAITQRLDAEIAARQATEEVLRLSNETLQQGLADRSAVVEQQEAQLRVLASAVSHAEQRERRRLAQVLHDQLQQILIAARLKVGVLHRRTEEEGTHELLDELDEMLDQAIAESRFLTTELCPPMLHEAGLAAALEWLACQTRKRHGVNVEVQADPAPAPLSEEMRTFLFHAAREALFNVVKHAQTEQAWVRVTETPDGMVGVEILDKGIGCDPTRLEHRGTHCGHCGGFGLFSIRARLEVLRGRCEVETTPGQGTRVAIFVPASQA